MRRRYDRGRQRLQRHSRHVVLAGLVFVVVSFAGIAWRAASLGAWLRDPLYADKADRLLDRLAAKTTNGVKPLTIVMFGSSRTSNALRGTDLEIGFEKVTGRPVVAFNFGIPSSGPVTQLLYLRRMFADGIRPDLVLFEIMPALLAGQVDKPIEQHFFAPERLLPGEGEFVIAHSYPAKFAEGERLATWFPLYGMRQPIRGRFLPSWSAWNMRCDSSRNSDETGWMRPVFDPVTDEQHKRGVAWARQEYADLLLTLQLYGPACAAVDESIRACRAAGAPITLVLMPEGADFRAMYTPRALAALDTFMRLQDCAVIDARMWLDDDAFSDSHHMVSSGAREFTHRLGEIIVERNLTGPP
jgi:hypothetical protein